MKTRITLTLIMFVLLTSVYGQLFQKNYTIPGVNFHDLNIEKLLDDSNDLIVAGAVFDNAYTNPEISIFRMDDLTGNVLYQETYASADGNVGNPRVFDVVRFQENGNEMIAIAGSVELGGKNVPAIIKIKASNGAFVDGAYYTNMHEDFKHAQGLHIIYTEQNQDKGFVLGGFANQDYYETTNDEHMGFVMRTKLDLSIIWTTSVYTNYSNASFDYDMVNHITETGDGYFVTGSCTGMDAQGTKQAVLAIKLSNTGGLVWDQSYIHGNSRDVGVDAYYDAGSDDIYLLANYSAAHYFGVSVFDNNTGTPDLSRTWRAYDWNDLDKYAFTITKSELNSDNLVISGYDRDASWYDKNGNYISGQTVPFVYEFDKITGNQVGSSYLYHIPYQHPAGFYDYFNFWNAQMPLIYYPDISVSSSVNGIHYFNVAYRNQITSGEVDLELIKTDSDHLNVCEGSTHDFNHETIGYENVDIMAGQLLPTQEFLEMKHDPIGFEVDSCNVSIPEENLDFGDAPEIAGTPFMYPTTLANNGARHLIDPDIFLGMLIDPEQDGQPSLGADCDDNDCIFPSLGDDEDGVVLPASALLGAMVNITVTASVDGYLDAWMDFNIDGDWADAGEHIFVMQFISAGANALSFTIPGTANTGQSYLRFRFRNSSATITYDGLVENGEVEDYRMEIKTQTTDDLDFGDAPEDPAGIYQYPTLLASNGARHIINADIFLGYLIDGEADGQPSVGADCDDTDCIYPSLGDDEDGVFLPGSVVPGAVVPISVIASVDGFLDAWMDFNLDGDWNDGGEHIFNTQFVSAGFNALSFNVPTSASYGQSYLRFRFRDYQSPISYDGLAQNGEVEDYTLEIKDDPQDELDFGDAPEEDDLYMYPTTLAKNGARHMINPDIFLGSLIDGEANGQPSVGADCDDNDCVYPSLGDDEDGVVMPAAIFAGTFFTMVVSASTTGFLDVWFDLNIDGDWADAGEHIFTTLPISGGVNVLTYSVPTTASLGQSYMRFRFRDYNAPISFDGLVENGEVEDYPINIEGIQSDLMDFGDAPDDPYPTLLANDGARHFNDGVTFLGDLIDTEPDGQPSFNALCDDNDCLYPALGDDEDGVTFVNKIRKGRIAKVDVVASVDGYLNTWIDFDKNGSWADAGEQVFVDLPVTAGMNNLSFAVPLSAKKGKSYIRFRFTTYPGVDFKGLAENGEVEDYIVKIYPKWTLIPTNLTHVIALPNILEPIAAGDVIGAFHTNFQGEEKCAGLLEVGENRNEAMVLFGDDLTTPDIKEGFAEGEDIVWRVFSFNSEKDHDLSMVYDPALPNSDGKFADGGISAVTEIIGVSVFALPDDVTICQGVLVQLSAYATGGSWDYTWEWTSDPVGLNSDQQSVLVQPMQTTSYYVEVSDGLFNAYDMLMVSVVDAPMADAGGDATICENESYQLSGNALNYSSTEWQTLGDGSFDDATASDATYTPGTADIINGWVELSFVAAPFDGCNLYASDNMVLTLDKVQAIALKSGWQGISSYLSLSDPNIETVVEPLGTNLTLMYNNTGMYWSAEGINTLDVWDDYAAYITKVVSDDVLYVCGSELTDKSMELNPEWNIIPVLCESSALVEEVFADLEGMVLVKEIGGSGVYWPNYDVNTLEYLVSGRGYLAYASNGGDISYVGTCDAGDVKSLVAEIESPWNEVLNTAVTHTIAIPNNALSDLKVGDVIGAFTASGLCAGYAVYQSHATAISLNGDDVQSLDIDGFQVNESISFKLYRASSGEEFDLDVEYLPGIDNAGIYINNGMSVINSLKLSSTGISTNKIHGVKVYPNPTTGTVTLSGFNAPADFEITNSMGAVVYSGLIVDSKMINLSFLSEGVYLVKITSQQGVHFEKLIVR